MSTTSMRQTPVRYPQFARPWVLVVEDEPIMALDLADALREAGFAVLGPASTSGEALDLLESNLCHVAVIDMLLGNTSGRPVAIDLQRRDIPFVRVTGPSDPDYFGQFSGCNGVFSKPVNLGTLVVTLRNLVRKSRPIGTN